MVAKRVLPERRNPLIAPASSPSKESLIERRRLGQTNLPGTPDIGGGTNASKTENSGTFDYAHLRVPLPKDLSGSGIFKLKSTTAYPEAYFLMRRSSDGYVSATGMFKAAFPWASLAEEEAERKYQKTFQSGGPEEAGSVWIVPDEALALAEQYGIRVWIEALLDPAPIEKGSKEKSNTHIQMPPKYDITKASPPAIVLPPTSALRSTRARSSRSVSPSKIATPSRKMASPRKSRTRRAAKAEAVHLEEMFETKTTSSPGALQNALENGTTASESVASESVNGEVKEPDTVRIEVQETVEQNGDVETTTTNVKIDVPANHPEIAEPEDPTKMIEEAKRMVHEANLLEGGAVKAGKSKRKADDLSRDENEVEAPRQERPAKLARTMSTTEQKLAKEKVTRRALVGLGVMAAIGSAVGYFAGLA